MIKIDNLNKYYFKGDSRELHVVNNVSLTLPDSGLVTILGPSGSGKTTLLNIIGGLDNYYSGQIAYNDKLFKKYRAKDIDLMRSEEIGYVFQNYLLFPNYSVYDNLKIALEIIDIYDPNEQKKRIEYALSSVGMYKYRRKKVKNLSGGQMQRVSIARALVKKTKMIIADEPTGNIDSENTIEVMNILKRISENTLVLLVTHEENIAYHYSDRIIKMLDGKIIADDENIEKEHLISDKNINKIYLKDLDNKVYDDDVKLEVYTDHSLNDEDIKLIIKNNTIYIETKNNLINIKESSVQLIDDHYQEIVEQKEEDFVFDNSFYVDKKSNDFIFRLKSHFKEAFSEVFRKGKKTIALLIVFALLGGLFALSTINLAKTINRDENYQLNFTNSYTIKEKSDYHLLSDDDKKILKEAYNQNLIRDLIVVSAYERINITKPVNSFKNSETNNDGFILYGQPKNIIWHNDNTDGIIISKKFADDILKDAKNSSYELLNDYKINHNVIKGVCSDDFYGYYSTINNDLFNEYCLDIIFNVNNYENAKTFFNNQNHNLSNVKDNYLQQNKTMNLNNNRNSVIFLVVLVVIFILYTYFSNRSKLINENYFYGVYRSLGKSKKQMYLSNILYNILKTTFSSVIGYFVVMAIYFYFRSELALLFDPLSALSRMVIIFGWILLYLFNILFGIIPLHGLLKKTPAQINSKYDM